MRMKRIIILSHIVLLILASTDFTLVTWFGEAGAWRWTYFQYSFRSGYGHPFVSDYGLGQVLCYCFAYGLGIVSFLMTRYTGWVSIGFLLCIVGFLSFILELSHWVFSHHLSAIINVPVVVLLIWIILGCMQVRKNLQNRQRSASAPAA